MPAAARFVRRGSGEPGVCFRFARVRERLWFPRSSWSGLTSSAASTLDLNIPGVVGFMVVKVQDGVEVLVGNRRDGVGNSGVRKVDRLIRPVSGPLWMSRTFPGFGTLKRQSVREGRHVCKFWINGAEKPRRTSLRLLCRASLLECALDL